MANGYTYNNGGTTVNTTPTGLTVDEVAASTTDFPKIEENKGDSLGIQSLSSKEISTSFGRDEDFIELHVFNNSNQLIFSEQDFKDYTLEREGDKVTAININAEQILADRNFTTGEYIIKVHVLRNKIFNTSFFPFLTREISVSRREIKSIALDTNNTLFDQEIENFILEIEGSSYFKEFSLNFGEGKLYSGINILLNTDPLKHEVIFKTLDPLPVEIKKDNSFKIVEELADPLNISVDLGGAQVDAESIELMGPNFEINTRQNNSIPSEFKTYDELLQYSVTSSYSKLLSKLENPDILNIQYDFIRTVSSSMEELDRPYHFENFVHFSSAVDRLKNFKYKLKLIELYDSQIVSSSLITSSNSYTTFKEKTKTKKQNLIKGFDGYEQFLYFTSGSLYTWPKSNDKSPYQVYSVTSSEAKDWLGIR